MANHEITAIEVKGTGFNERWNISMLEYEMLVDGKRTKVDFQDLMVNVAENQALAIEQEVQPEATRIQKRTNRLKIVGDAMAELSAFKFDTKDNSNPSASAKITKQTWDMLTELSGSAWGTWESWYNVNGQSVSRTKAQVDSGNQYLKSESDKLNNDQQLAMSRLESLVQGRDQNFNMASTLMQHVSEARGSTIKSMG